MENERIALSLPHTGGNEQKYVDKAIETNWVVPLGPDVQGFEKDMERFWGEEKPVVALSSGTAAIHLALVQLNEEKTESDYSGSSVWDAGKNG